MRRRTPMWWIEEAEARRMRLFDAEAKPASPQPFARPEFWLVTKATLTVLVTRMTERLAGTAHDQPSAGEKDPAEGCDYKPQSWVVFGCGGAPYRIARASAALREGTTYASSYSREIAVGIGPARH